MLENSVSDKSLIPYDVLIERSLRSVIRSVLKDISQKGLPGEHHFYVTFNTTHEGVQMPDYLREQYPDAITIVLQHQFERLSVSDNAFEVWLTFRSAPERIVVPFGAISDFTDPAAQFRLQFQTLEEANEDLPEDFDGDDTFDEEQPSPEKKAKGENVISLDSFRPKK